MTSKLKQATRAHYDRLLACTTVEEFETEGWDSRQCPLCVDRGPRGCNGCPVMVRTGEHSCHKTPYHEMSEVLDTFGEDLDPEDEPLRPTLEECHGAVQKERDFLESLEYPDEP